MYSEYRILLYSSLLGMKRRGRAGQIGGNQGRANLDRSRLDGWRRTLFLRTVRAGTQAVILETGNYFKYNARLVH
jgi:hypothetical protein